MVKIKKNISLLTIVLVISALYISGIQSGELYFNSKLYAENGKSESVLNPTKNYYVDYESGNDSNNGLSKNSAWKHAPGDSESAGIPAKIKLAPGSAVLFKGDVVYRGNVKISASGSLKQPIIYNGNSWPAGSKAIIDGADLVTGWTKCKTVGECGGNSNFSNIYYTTIDGSFNPLELNLHEINNEKDEFLWITQYPAPKNQYFFEDHTSFRTIKQTSFNRKSITDSGCFNQPDPNYWNDAFIMMWINPNKVVFRKINNFEPGAKRITFDDLGADAIYPGGKDQSFAVYNSVHHIEKPGQYAVGADIQGKRKIYLWPRTASNLNMRISMSVRKFGIDIAGSSNVIVEGFLVRKHSDSKRSIGIGSYSSGHIKKSRVTIRNNFVEHNYNGSSIYLSNVSQSSILNNRLNENPKQSGIFIEKGKDVTIQGNIVNRSGATSIRLYTVELGRVIGNMVTESQGSHANGMTFYIACNNILIANNKVFSSVTPITLQDSGNLYFINNLVDAGETPQNQAVSEWVDTKRGPWNNGTIAFMNNTFVRHNENKAIMLGGENPKNRYLIVNNITDGLITNIELNRHHNIYTGLSWLQKKKTWTWGEKESLVTDVDSIFENPPSQNFKLKKNSPAAGAGASLKDIFPANIFPEFNYKSDIDGKERKEWDLGAYAR